MLRWANGTPRTTGCLPPDVCACPPCLGRRRQAAERQTRRQYRANSAPCCAIASSRSMACVGPSTCYASRRAGLKMPSGDPNNLQAMFEIFDDKRHPYYEFIRKAT